MVGMVIVGGGGGGNQTTTETPTSEGTPEESPTPEETPTEGDVEVDGTPSTGQPGFGVLAALGGLAGSAVYLFSRRDDSDE